MVRRSRQILIVFLAFYVVVLAGCGDADLKKARRLHEQRDYQGAIGFYKKVVEREPENMSARYGLIEAYTQQLTEQPPQEITAAKVEETMMSVRPIAAPLMDDPHIKRYVSMVYQMVAKRYAEEGQDDKATGAWAEVVKIEPEFAEAWFNLGIGQAKTELYEESLVSFKKAVELNPYFFKGYFAMGSTLLQLGRSEEAIEQFLKALELNPDDPALHNNLGFAYAAAGQDEKAVEEFKRAIQIDQSHFQAYVGLREQYRKMKNEDGVKEVDQMWKDFTEAAKKARQDAQDKASPSAVPSAPPASTGG
jgi:tetratricopeptide (TPR) repeat protein